MLNLHLRNIDPCPFIRLASLLYVTFIKKKLSWWFHTQTFDDSKHEFWNVWSFRTQILHTPMMTFSFNWILVTGKLDFFSWQYDWNQLAKKGLDVVWPFQCMSHIRGESIKRLYDNYYDFLKCTFYSYKHLFILSKQHTWPTTVQTSIIVHVKK